MDRDFVKVKNNHRSCCVHHVKPLGQVLMDAGAAAPQRWLREKKYRVQRDSWEHTRLTLSPPPASPSNIIDPHPTATRILPVFVLDCRRFCFADVFVKRFFRPWLACKVNGPLIFVRQRRSTYSSLGHIHEIPWFPLIFSVFPLCIKKNSGWPCWKKICLGFPLFIGYLFANSSATSMIATAAHL